MLGGGVVPGSLVLIGGEPGIGKSTLLLQAAAKMARAIEPFYSSGEQTEHQIKSRGERLEVGAAPLPPGRRRPVKTTRDIPIAISIGVAEWDRGIGQFPDRLIAHADHALYAAKKNGKNDFAVYDPAPPLSPERPGLGEATRNYSKAC